MGLIQSMDATCLLSWIKILFTCLNPWEFTTDELSKYSLHLFYSLLVSWEKVNWKGFVYCRDAPNHNKWLRKFTLNVQILSQFLNPVSLNHCPLIECFWYVSLIRYQLTYLILTNSPPTINSPILQMRKKKPRGVWILKVPHPRSGWTGY